MKGPQMPLLFLVPEPGTDTDTHHPVWVASSVVGLSRVDIKDMGRISTELSCFATLHYHLKKHIFLSWPGSSMGWSIVLTCQGHGFDP